MLAESGYEIVLAEDGEQAIARFKEARPDLALLDVMMPKLSGVDICRWIKTGAGAAAGPFVPVLMISAISDSESKIEGLDAGADDWLVKPFNPFELRARVAELMATDAAARVLIVSADIYSAECAGRTTAHRCRGACCHIRRSTSGDLRSVPRAST